MAIDYSQISRNEQFKFAGDGQTINAKQSGVMLAGLYTSSNPSLSNNESSFLRTNSTGALLVDIQGATLSIGGDINVDVAAYTDTGGTQADAMIFTDGEDLSGVSQVWQGFGAYERANDKFRPLELLEVGTSYHTMLDLSSVAGTATDVDAGVVGPGTQRVTLASDDPAVVDLAAIEVLNTTIAGDTTSIDAKTPALGTAVMTGSVPVTLATDDVHFGAVGVAADVDGVVHGQLRFIGEAVDGLEADLSTLAAVDFATETTLATIAGLDFATETTLATLGTESTLDSVKTAVELIDDVIGTSDSAAPTKAAQIGILARDTLPTAVGVGDTARYLGDLYGRTYNANHDMATGSEKVTEQSPVSQHYVADTEELTNITTNTTGYIYYDMAGYRYLGLQAETSGETPTDTLTMTIEGTMQDDGTAQASCVYQDITEELLGTGVTSKVDADWRYAGEVVKPYKYIRIKYVTSDDSGNDADLTVYSKRLY